MAAMKKIDGRDSRPGTTVNSAFEQILMAKRPASRFDKIQVD
jgi:hypothetical protein